MACGKGEIEDSANQYLIFYSENLGSSLLAKEYTIDETGRNDIAARMLTMMTIKAEDEAGEPVIGETTKVISFDCNGDTITVDMDAAYNDLPADKEIIVREALVKTLIQIPDIEWVTITVDNNSLRDDAGNVIEKMSESDFLSKGQDIINTSVEADVTLYFADKQKSALEHINRHIMYSANMSAEMAVIRELLKGPEKGEGYKVIACDITDISVYRLSDTVYIEIDGGIENIAVVNPRLAEDALRATIAAVTKEKNIVIKAK